MANRQTTHPNDLLSRRKHFQLRPQHLIQHKNFARITWSGHKVLLLACLLERIRDVILVIPWLLSVTVPVESPFLYVVVGNREEIHGVLDKFLVLLRSVSQEVPARAIDDADVPI